KGGQREERHAGRDGPDQRRGPVPGDQQRPSHQRGGEGGDDGRKRGVPPLAGLGRGHQAGGGDGGHHRQGEDGEPGFRRERRPPDRESESAGEIEDREQAANGGE